MLATGGIGRAFKITSNSWEYTGDGHALAYHAGAELMDMEFVQFHPTGMVWPPSVRGILVTEGVRGEGGVLRNKEGKRFMFDDIPENYKNQTADNEEEGWRYTQGDKNARRPPELLTRDHVARCIKREVKAGRGSPHGGVFLDIAWIKEKLPNAAEHIKKKLPSMYHQFKQLADIDITKEPMEVGPTTHYIMGGVRVDGDIADVDRARPVRRGRVRRRACTARIGWAATRSPTCWCSASAPASTPRSSPRQTSAGNDRPWTQVDAAAQKALEPFERGAAGENPFADPARAAGHDAGPGRHRAHARTRCSRRSTRSTQLQAARREGRRHRQPRIQPRLAHRARSGQPADGLRGDHPRGASSARRAAAATSATTIPKRSDECGQVQPASSTKGAGRRDAASTRRPIAPHARRTEAGHRGAMK